MKKVLWFVAIVIIIVFGFMGEAYLLQDSRSQAPTYAGVVFGKKVSLGEYQSNYSHVELQAILKYGQNFRKIQEFLDLDAQTWDRIIILHEANKRKIDIPNEDVVNTIQNFPFFQIDGQFDTLLYNDILRSGLKISAHDFEEGTRNTLKFTKLYEMETANIDIQEEEIFSEYKKRYEKAQISYLLFPNENFKDQITYDEVQAKKYYIDHQQEFLMPSMINVEYIRIDYPPEALAAAQSPAGPQEDQEEKGSEDTAKINVKAEAAKEAVEDKAYEIALELQDNSDFHEVAQKFGLQVETSGFFSMEHPNLTLGWSFPMIQKIFQAKVGELLEPVETPTGYQILRVKGKKESSIPNYEDAKEQVKEAWTVSQAKSLSRKSAEKYLKIILDKFTQFKRLDFAQIAKEHGIEIHQTPVFNRGQYLPNIGISKDFQDAAFSLSDSNKVSDVVETDKGYSILHLDSIVPINMEDFTKKKEELVESLLLEKKNKSFNDFITQLRLKANLVNHIPELKANAQL